MNLNNRLTHALVSVGLLGEAVLLVCYVITYFALALKPPRLQALDRIVDKAWFVIAVAAALLLVGKMIAEKRSHLGNTELSERLMAAIAVCTLVILIIFSMTLLLQKRTEYRVVDNQPSVKIEGHWQAADLSTFNHVAWGNLRRGIALLMIAWLLFVLAPITEGNALGRSIFQRGPISPISEHTSAGDKPRI